MAQVKLATATLPPASPLVQKQIRFVLPARTILHLPYRQVLGMEITLRFAAGYLHSLILLCGLAICHSGLSIQVRRS